MSPTSQPVRAGAYFDVLAAVFISLLVQTTMSLFAASVPVLAPAIAAERGWSPTIITFYPIALYVTAFLISFQVPRLLFQMGGMGLSLASVAFAGVGLLFLLSPSAATAALAPVTIGCGTAAMNPASSQILGPRTTAPTAALVMSIKQTGVPMGGVAAGALVPMLVAHSGWRAAAIELVAIGAALAVCPAAFGALAERRGQTRQACRVPTARPGKASPRRAGYAYTPDCQPYIQRHATVPAFLLRHLSGEQSAAQPGRGRSGV